MISVQCAECAACGHILLFTGSVGPLTVKNDLMFWTRTQGETKQPPLRNQTEAFCCFSCLTRHKQVFFFFVSQSETHILDFFLLS